MTSVVQVREIAPRTKNNSDGHTMDLHDEPVVQRRKPERTEEHSPAPAEPVSPPKPGRRPWVWALLGAAAVAATGAGIAYYVHCLSFESTDDAFIDGHVAPVSSRVAGHVAKVCVEDNQLVKQGELLAELDPSDFETRLAAAEAALQTAQATSKARATGVAAAGADWEQSKADLAAAEAREVNANARLKRIAILVPNVRRQKKVWTKQRPRPTWREPM